MLRVEASAEGLRFFPNRHAQGFVFVRVYALGFGVLGFLDLGNPTPGGKEVRSLRPGASDFWELKGLRCRVNLGT